jgi:membrane-bound lytic murein transglycosylase MltF
MRNCIKYTALVGLFKFITMFALIFFYCTFAIAEDKYYQAVMSKLKEPWKGDLDGMIERRTIRALVVFNKTNFFLDGLTTRGITYDALMEFENYLNEELKRKHLKLHVITIPVTRDQIFSFLEQGLGDIAAANLTITPERLGSVDFSIPFYSQVRELVVTSSSTGKLEGLKELSGKTVAVKKSSSYYQSLLKHNLELVKAGKSPIDIQPVDEHLETEDILEMVNADLMAITVADNYLLDFWAQVFNQMIVHPNLSLRNGGKIAWAIRKNSPQLRNVINAFVPKVKKGTLMGNILFKRYLQNTQWVRNALGPEDVARFQDTIKYFKKYASQYGFDWLMVAALAYQESRLDQSVRSSRGAVGIMQLLPSTAAGNPINIENIDLIDNNIHAGVKYLDFIYERYFNQPDIEEFDKILLTFATYNAGPAKVISLRNKTKAMGLNPNVWFSNVEVAAARVIGRETVQYVSNIFKYYLAYKHILSETEKK